MAFHRVIPIAKSKLLTGFRSLPVYLIIYKPSKNTRWLPLVHEARLLWLVPTLPGLRPFAKKLDSATNGTTLWSHNALRLTDLPCCLVKSILRTHCVFIVIRILLYSALNCVVLHPSIRLPFCPSFCSGAC